MKRLVVAVGLVLAGWSPASAHAVGFTIRVFPYELPDGGTKWLRMAVWYPSVGPTQSYKYGLIAGQVVREGPVVAGTWPLIVHSHGIWECGVASAYLLQTIASQGYIVAAPDHEDAASCLVGGGTGSPAVSPWDLTKSTFQNLLQNFPRRPLDLSAAIDEMFRLNRTPSSGFHGRVDELNVTASGHSLGGWTAASVGGGILDYRDPRVQNLLLWSPNTRLEWWFYAQLQSPVMWLSGQYDSSAYSAFFRTWAYDWSPAPKYPQLPPRGWALRVYRQRLRVARNRRALHGG